MRGKTITILNSRQKGPREFGPVVSLFVFVPLLAIAGLMSLPFIPIVAWWENRRKRLLVSAMAARNRTMQWPDFANVIEQKRGTLIVEGDPRKGPNLWWTAEDILAISPHPCPRDLQAFSDPTYKPFGKWCRERYTSPITGSAFLALGGKGEHRGFPLGSDDEGLRGTGIFENMPTILLSRRH